MIKLRFPILAVATLCAAFITKPSLAIEDCYSTPLTDAIDGEYNQIECDMAADKAELEYHAEQQALDELELEAEVS